MTTPAKPEPTPATDKALANTQGMFRAASATNGFTEHSRTLERHLRRIVECRDNLIKPDEMGTFGELMNAIRDAKETLSK